MFLHNKLYTLLIVVIYFSVSHKLVSGKEGVIEFKTGTIAAISKSRQNGHLLVVKI